MPILQLNFNFEINESAQEGDAVFVFQNLANTAGFSVDSANSTTYLGNIIRLNNPDLHQAGTSWMWVHLPAGSPHLIAWNNLVAGSDYIMFQKNRAAGVSGVLGYYAEMEFRNNSETKAELFSIGSEVFESSK